MKPARKIAVMTGTRAEYGLLKWLLLALQSDPRAELVLLVTGTHLSREFGHTIDQIKEDGFEIAYEIPCLTGGDDEFAMGKNFAMALSGFVDALSSTKPDMLVVLGDRFECLAATISAAILRIPVAHIHGGEVTEGAIDESFRHATTKLSHLHFAAAQSYADRIVQLGESPECVFNFGTVGLESFQRLQFMTTDELANSIPLDFSKPFGLVTYHPVTLGSLSPDLALKPLLEAMERLQDMQFIVTMANADAGGKAINDTWRTFCDLHKERIYLTESLGHLRYLSAMRHAAFVLGNSSSGIIEAPAINVPTINIGERQSGRLRALSVIDCKENSDEIIQAVTKANDAKFLMEIANAELPYGRPGAIADQIMEQLLTIDLEALRTKRFHDLKI